MIAIFTALGMLLFYSITYLLMLKPTIFYSIMSYPNQKQARTGGFKVPVRYRFGGVLTRTFFAPAHWIDRQIRPALWTSATDFENVEYWENP
jgi:hypothetical protein